MKGFVQDIEGLADVHKIDQFFCVEEGTGEAVLDGVRNSRLGVGLISFNMKLGMPSKWKSDWPQFSISLPC